MTNFASEKEKQSINQNLGATVIPHFIMMKIYCLTEWDSHMKQANIELFMSMSGVANWLTKKNPINNQFHLCDRAIEGDYDINVENLMYVLSASERNNMGAAFTIKQDFFIQTIETRFTLSTVNVND